MDDPRWRPALLLALLFWLFLQLTASFVEAVYAFGLLATDVPPAVALVLLAFLAPLALLAFRDRFPRALRIALGLGLIGCALAEPQLSGVARVLAGGLGVAAGLALLPLSLRFTSVALGIALAPAVMGSALARAAGSGLDASRRGLGALAAVAVALLAAWLLWTSPEPRAERPSDLGWGRAIVLALGANAAVALALHGFMAPSVLARWADASHAAVAAVLAASWSLALALAALRPGWLRPAALSLGAALFATLLALALHAHQPDLPAAGGYPYEARISAAAAPLFWAMLGLSGIVPIALAALAEQLARAAPRKLAVAFTLGAVLLLALVAAQILTSIYAYVPVVGPLFRERFWLVTALPAAIVAAALAFGSRPSPGAPTWPWPLTAALIGAGAALAARLGEPEVAPDGARLRFVSYNIQQGFSESGIDDIDAQLAVLMELDPDVVALQECDTARLAGANEDVVRYLARRLGMRAVYGPGPAAGTFGVTLLSRYPIEGARTIYLESEGEQTAAVIATLRVGRERHQVVATHLGNDGPAVQLDNVLAAVRDAPSVVLLGDFNFVAGAPQYRATTARLDDAWERAARRASERGPGDIDHAFVSRSLRVRAAGYQRSAASDHPALWIELE